MPTSAPKPCTQCATLVADGTSRCAAHKVVAGTFADSRRGTRQQRGYGAAWDRLRVGIMRRDRGLCQECYSQGRMRVGNDVDHTVPKAKGGTDDPANLRLLCRACHKAKTAAEALQGRGVE